MSDPRVDLRALDANAITAMLARVHPGSSATAVRIVERARCGDGVASTADRVVVEVDLAPGHAPGLPERMVVKTLLLHPVFRFGLPAILSLSAAARATERIPALGPAVRSASSVRRAASTRWAASAFTPASAAS